MEDPKEIMKKYFTGNTSIKPFFTEIDIHRQYFLDENYLAYFMVRYIESLILKYDDDLIFDSTIYKTENLPNIENIKHFKFEINNFKDIYLYDNHKEEQWNKSGFNLDELLFERADYIVYKKRIILPKIIKLTDEFVEYIVKYSTNNNIPLCVMVKIYKYILYGKSNDNNIYINNESSIENIKINKLYEVIYYLLCEIIDVLLVLSGCYKYLVYCAIRIDIENNDKIDHIIDKAINSLIIDVPYICIEEQFISINNLEHILKFIFNDQLVESLLVNLFSRVRLQIELFLKMKKNKVIFQDEEKDKLSIDAKDIVCEEETCKSISKKVMHLLVDNYSVLSKDITEKINLYKNDSNIIEIYINKIVMNFVSDIIIPDYGGIPKSTMRRYRRDPEVKKIVEGYKRGEYSNKFLNCFISYHVMACEKKKISHKG